MSRNLPNLFRKPINLGPSPAGWAMLGLIAFLATARAKEPLMVGQPSGQILAGGDRRVMILSPAGEVVWEYPTKLTHDVWMLPNGNVLFADGESVTEVTREKKVVFQYRAVEPKGGGTYACQRLADGKTLVAENSTGRLLELNPDGKVAFALQTAPFKAGQHHNLRMARKLASGNYLVCHSGARLVKEYTPKGEVVWEVGVPGALAFAAVRTPAGTTLVSCLDRVVEYDPSGKGVWECRTDELGVGTVRNLTGINLLPNGNIVAGCYSAYAEGQGSGLLELSREKQAVWRYSKPSGGDRSMMAVELLSPDGMLPAGNILR